MQSNPERRYPSASEFAADLNAFLEGKPTAPEAMPPEDDEPEATRRTRGPLRQKNRRSGNPPDRCAAPRPGYARASPTEPVVRKTKPPLTPRQRQIRFFASLALCHPRAAARVQRSHACGEAGRSSRARSNPSVSPTWTRPGSVTKASQKTSFIPLLLSAPRNAIQSKLISAADAVINEYRSSDAPNVTEKEWIRAHDVLAKALQIDPSNRDVRGKLYLAEGHLSRIRGTSRGDGKLLNDARAKFEQAAELMPQSPDPYLGLARLYVYSLHDVDRAEKASKAADKRGHEMGRREKAQLADGYRDRGERLMREAVKAAGLPEEKDLLKRAEDDLKRAEDLLPGHRPLGQARPPTSGECLKISTSSTRDAMR